MYIKHYFYLSIIIFTNIVYANVPFEVLQSCINLKPYNDYIKITNIDINGAISTENKCDDKYSMHFENRTYGTVVCGNLSYLIINDSKIRADSAINKSINPEIKPGVPISITSEWYKIEHNKNCFLCINAPLTQSGTGSNLEQYYIIENAFDDKKEPVIYYYFFEKNIIPIDSPNL